jgi:hypothetical protein
MTQDGDLVLVHMDGQPAFFARIESIASDVKPEWFQVTMLVLKVPIMLVTWILRSPYINGEEFTMGGRPVRLEKVVSPQTQSVEPNGPEVPGEAAVAKVAGNNAGLGEERTRKVVSLADRRKKDQSP